MEITLNKNELCKMLEIYYEDQADIKGQASISVTNGLVGYGMTEHNDCILKIKISGKIQIGTSKVKIESSLTKEDLKEAISIYDENHNLKSDYEKLLKIYEEREDEEDSVYKLFLKGIKENHIELKNPEVTLYMIIELVSSTCFNSILYHDPLPIEEFKPYLYDTIRRMIEGK